jgi:glycosyltransferase involved in cell wall biosynthesis
MHKKKIAFLYFELAGYFMACIDKLVEKYNPEVHIIKYPVNSVAPFQFAYNPAVKYYDYKPDSSEDLIRLIDTIGPDVIYICGWSNKDYVSVARHLNKRIPVILTFDNPWRGTIRQWIAAIAGRFYLHRLFTHCWVPGEPNARYAHRLGYSGSRLLTGLYSADYALFHQSYLDNREKKRQKFPHRFIFVGRYTRLKGVMELWQAFIQLHQETDTDWELWCLGKGELDHAFPVHDKIRNFGFVQPQEMKSYLEQTGVFILPAHYEHWGVVVHEFAAAGFPLLCTSTTSAASAFLQNGINGYIIEPYSTSSLVQALKKIVALSDDELIEMAEKSASFSEVITPEKWADKLMEVR